MRTECSICGRYFAVELSVKDYGFMRIRISELMDYHWQLHHQGSPKISAILNEEYEGVSNVASEGEVRDVE